MNSEDRGIQPASLGDLEGKFETPDSKQFPVHSFTNCTIPNNSKSHLKEEKDEGVDDSLPVQNPLSTFQDTLSVKAEEPDRDQNAPEQGSSRISKATISKEVKLRKNAERRHIGAKIQRKFSCEICGRHFRRPDSLKIHRRVHSGERPFTCKVCLKTFNMSNVLKQHIRVHTGERPFKCEVCFTSFKESWALKIHLRTHTGEQPF